MNRKMQVDCLHLRMATIATILDKTVEEIAFLGGIFSELRSQPILPSAPSPGSSVLLGLQKKAGSPSICRKQL